MLDRRKFLRAALWVAAAPVIVRASSLMHVRALLEVSGQLPYVGPDLSVIALLESLQNTRWEIEGRMYEAGAGYSFGESITFA